MTEEIFKNLVKNAKHKKHIYVSVSIKVYVYAYVFIYFMYECIIEPRTWKFPGGICQYISIYIGKKLSCVFEKVKGLSGPQ